MALNYCSHCHQSFAADLPECPHCHTPAAAAGDVETISEDDILEVLAEDIEAAEVPEDALVVEEDVLEPVADEGAAVTSGELADIIEIVDEEVPPAAEPPPDPDQTLVPGEAQAEQAPPAEEETLVHEAEEVLSPDEAATFGLQPDEAAALAEDDVLVEELERAVAAEEAAAMLQEVPPSEETTVALHPDEAPAEVEPETITPQAEETLLPKAEEALFKSKPKAAEPPPEPALQADEPPPEPESKADEPPKPAAPPSPKATTLRPRVVPATMLGARQGAHTMLSDAQEPLNLPDSGLGGPGAADVAGVGDSLEGLDMFEVSQPGEPKAADLEEVPPPGRAQESGDVDLLEQMLSEERSGADLGKKAGEPVSGVDVIAEELESRTDVGSHKEGAGDDVAESDVDLGGKAASPSEGLIEFEEEAIEVGAADLLEQDEAIEVGAADLWEEPAEESVSVGDVDAADLISEDDLLGEETVAPSAVAPAARKKPARKAPAVVELEADMMEEADAALTQVGPKRRLPRPRYGRRWLGGTLVGLLLAVGALAAIWYFQPELLLTALKEHPSYKIPEKPLPPTPLSQVALGEMVTGNYDQALTTLEQAGSSPDVVGTRGTARLLKYLKENKGQLKVDAKDVKKALHDLGEAKMEPLVDQLDASLKQAEVQQNLEKARKALETTLGMVDSQLKEAKVNKTGVEGVAALVTARDTLTKQIFDLKTEEAKVKEQVKDLVVKEKILPPNNPALDNVPLAVAALVAARKASQAEMKTVVDTLANNNLVVDPQTFDLKNFDNLAKQWAEARTVVAALEKQLKVKPSLQPAQVQSLQANLAELKKIATAALTEMNEGKPLPPGTDPGKHLVESAKLIREKASSPLVRSLAQGVSSFHGVGGDAGSWLHDAVQRGRAEAQLSLYAAREPLVSTPDRRLDTWLTLMQDHDSKNATELAKATKDVNWVLSPNSGAGAEQRAKATYLKGLVLRNEGKFAQAKAELDKADKMAKDVQPPAAWAAKVSQAHTELENPSAFYLPTAQHQREAGDLSQALQTLELGLQAMPKAPQLLALRGRIRLEMARKQGGVAAAANDVRQDVIAAMADPASKANAFFTLGQLEEDLGNLDAAETSYRQAIKNTPENNAAEANQYRLALNRLLQRVQNVTPPTPNRLAQGAQLTVHQQRQPQAVIQAVPPISAWLVLGQPGPGADAKAKERARVEKWIEDARASLKSEEGVRGAKLKKLLDEAEIDLLGLTQPTPEIRGQGYMLLGRVLSETGKRTEGLKAFLHGLKLFHPEAELEQLNKLVENHPAFQIPEALMQPNPARAESHYGEGVHLYFEGKYTAAEAEFRRALGYHKNDARYHYFLGLTQLAQKTQKKREEAEFNFEQAGRLEVQSLPGTEEVNASLERIQGRLRQRLNEYRKKAAQVEAP